MMLYFGSAVGTGPGVGATEFGITVHGSAVSTTCMVRPFCSEDLARFPKNVDANLLRSSSKYAAALCWPDTVQIFK
ncbi:MAG: hypothetical protein M3Z41_00455 [Candidatus Eremiobacteraeota bacterium]|nr:hypothetical protein [Candidatus Eremiobacteraeota bacterium]